ncbi:MAG: hypothetical protein GIKADHBN_01186 [Phycisphaerales bacterium]|nr:hypothetical protein [Phycisphaerales bacterium]
MWRAHSPARRPGNRAATGPFRSHERALAPRDGSWRSRGIPTIPTGVAVDPAEPPQAPTLPHVLEQALDAAPTGPPTSLSPCSAWSWSARSLCFPPPVSPPRLLPRLGWLSLGPPGGVCDSCPRGSVCGVCAARAAARRVQAAVLESASHPGGCDAHERSAMVSATSPRGCACRWSPSPALAPRLSGLRRELVSDARASTVRWPMCARPYPCETRYPQL